MGAGTAAVAMGGISAIGNQRAGNQKAAAQQAQRDKMNQAAAHNMSETQQQLDAQSDIYRQKDIQAQIGNNMSSQQAAATSLVQAGATGTGGGAVAQSQYAAQRQGDSNAATQAMNFENQVAALQSKQNQAVNQFNERYNPNKVKGPSVLSSLIKGVGTGLSVYSMAGGFGKELPDGEAETILPDGGGDAGMPETSNMWDSPMRLPNISLS